MEEACLSHSLKTFTLTALISRRTWLVCLFEPMRAPWYVVCFTASVTLHNIESRLKVSCHAILGPVYMVVGGPQVGEVTHLAVVEKWNAFTCNVTTPGCWVRFFEVVVALAVEEFEQRRPKLTSRKRQKINSRTHMYLFTKASRVVLRGVWFREEPLT